MTGMPARQAGGGGGDGTYMAGDSQDPGLRDEKIGRHDEMKGGGGGEEESRDGDRESMSIRWVGDRRGGPCAATALIGR